MSKMSKLFINNLVVNKMTVSNLLISNLFTVATNGVFNTSNLVITNLTTESLNVTNSFVNSTNSNYVITNASMTNLSVTNSVETNSTATNLNAINSTFSYLFVTNTTDYGFVAQSNSAMAISAATETIITNSYWNGAAITSGGVSYSNGTYTVNNAGMYKVVASCYTSSTASIDIWVYIVRLGSNFRPGATSFPTSYRMNVNCLLLCQASDQIRIAVYSNNSFDLSAAPTLYYSIKKIS